jgi:peptidoglycan/xylan/chitin deacetylase (PgdA/CDA1 family)
MSLQSSDAAGVRDRLVLAYHGVSDVVSSPQTVTHAALRRQVAKLLDRGYVGTTFNRAVLEPSTSPRLAVTFDDGERNVLEHAFAVLSELGVPGTVFVPVGPVGGPGMLGWDELARLADAGWEVGSHSLSHARLTHVDDDALDHELRSSREAIEKRLDRPCRSIAYPYGASDDRVHAAAARAGYTAGCTTGGTLRAAALGWPRVGVDGSDGSVLFTLKTSRFGRSLRGTPLRRPFDQTGRVIRRLGVR